MLELFISQCQYKQSSVLAAIERKLNRIFKKGVFVLSLVVFSEFCSESLQEDDRCLQLNSVASDRFCILQAASCCQETISHVFSKMKYRLVGFLPVNDAPGFFFSSPCQTAHRIGVRG